MGIATRMRGLGNVGIHKYNHCKTVTEIKNVNPNYKIDLTIHDWNYKLDNLTNADSLMLDSTKLIRWNVDLPLCTSNIYMFKNCTNLVEYNGSIPNVTNAQQMFYNTNIDRTEYDFPNVTQGNFLFSCINRITTSSVNFPKLTNGFEMFGKCYRMTTFNGKFPAMTNGENVFRYNYNFSNFEADLPVLSNGNNIFADCILNKDSVIRIINSIPQYSSGTHTLTLGIHKELENDADVAYYIQLAKNKGWNPVVKYNLGYNGLEVLSDELNEKMELGIELPEGYTRLYYLEDYGKQWINTGYIPTVNTGLYVIAKQIVVNAGWPIGLATHTDGAYYGITAPLWARTGGTGSASSIYNSNVSQNSLGRGEAYEGWTNFLNEKVAKVDVRGTIYSRNLTKYTATYTHPLWISKTNAPRNTSTNTRAFNGRIYRVKISEGTEIVRDYLPALDPNGKPCMYELMEGKTYYNQGEREDFDYDFPPTNSN